MCSLGSSLFNRGVNVKCERMRASTAYTLSVMVRAAQASPDHAMGFAYKYSLLRKNHSTLQRGMLHTAAWGQRQGQWHVIEHVSCHIPAADFTYLCLLPRASCHNTDDYYANPSYFEARNMSLPSYEAMKSKVHVLASEKTRSREMARGRHRHDKHCPATTIG